MEDCIKTVYLKGGRKACIRYSDWCINPREEWSNIWKLTFRPHRSYKLPDEISFDFLWYDEWEKEAVEQMELLEKDYYVFFVDWYEHWWIAISLSWEWMQCRRDTARNAWLIAIPREYNWYDLELWKDSKNKEKWEKVIVDEKEAVSIARQEIKDFDKYVNGEQYTADIYEKRHYICEETWEKSEDREFIENTGLDYEVDEILDRLKDEYNDWEDLTDLD